MVDRDKPGEHHLGTKNLTITFNNGQSVLYTLNANEHRAFTIGSLFFQSIQPDIQSAVITNASGVIGLELFGNIGGSNHLDGILLTDKTASTIYYPHVASDGWWTGIVAYNPSASALYDNHHALQRPGDPSHPLNPFHRREGEICRPGFGTRPPRADGMVQDRLHAAPQRL